MKFSSASKYDVGSILWLPPKDEIPIEYHATANSIDDGCFNHPVVVLSVNRARTEVVVLIMTSFGGKDLQERHPRNTQTRSMYIPVHPSKAHPDNDSLLFLRGDGRLPRNSYVTLNPQRTIHGGILKPLRRSTCTLTTDSYKQLIKRVGFQPPPFHNRPPVAQPSQTPLPVREPLYDIPPVRQPLPEYVRPVVPQSRPAISSYPTPGRFTYVENRMSQPHVQTQRTQPLLPLHRFNERPAEEDPVPSCIIWGIMIIIIGAALLTLNYYKW
ncbi:hypothetical protein P153DRAFT_351626 [Dothidotthia symphoricarpi CBS 119687]|uniref:Uncharacterized protein n=1 Tax=Dothidotthia symphoricarpi CBS 119687 TaxID=1392245 RepID=A0A6A5ZWU1_9PLEO|nr:uncharacterized protein P153DRAFT_351626 [Dothidotthia symphoricarpi CBS 119687]KAF2123999.1 hypothetical protein P153DRAFT_351626 [Dothidotthia symphoricarpi CBS 119687]